MNKIEKYGLSLLFFLIVASCSNSKNRSEVRKCVSKLDEKSNLLDTKIELVESSYKQKILKILNKKLTTLRESNLKDLLKESHHSSIISKSDTLLRFQFLLNSKGKVIDTAILCSNASESINKAITNSVMELNFGSIPKDFVEKVPIFTIAIPYDYLF